MEEICSTALSFFYSLRSFSCLLAQYAHSSHCYLCLHHPLRSWSPPYPVQLQPPSTSLDMNYLYFTLFQAVHHHAISFFTSVMLPTAHIPEIILQVYEGYCGLLSSLIYHTISVLAAVISRNRTIDTIPEDTLTQDNELLHQQIHTCWLFEHATHLREFLWKHLLASPSMYSFHSTGVLYTLFSYILIDSLSAGLQEDLSNNMIQKVRFQSLLAIVNTIEEEFKKSNHEQRYQELVYSYQTVVQGILGMLGGTCINLLFTPSMITPFALLTSELVQWLMTISTEFIHDLILQQLIRIARYSMKVYHKSLHVLLPECVTARLVKMMMALETDRQEFIIQHVFAETQSSLGEWYSSVASYVVPIYIYLGDTEALQMISHAINPSASIYVTFEQLFAGSQCIYNVLMYFLKHIQHENKDAWKLLFFLRSPFDDYSLVNGSIHLPKYSTVSIRQMVQEKGYRMLWPLLYDCTTVISSDRKKSEEALEALYEYVIVNDENDE